jgi:signal transduction histidine kinase
MNGPESSQPAAAQLERRIAELMILYEVSRALQNAIDEEQALYTILVGVTSGRGLGFNRAFILLMQPEHNCLSGRLAIGPSSPEEAWKIWRELRANETLGELLDSINTSGIHKDLRVNEIVLQFSVPLDHADHPLIKVLKSREACLCVNGVLSPHDLPVDARTLELLGTPDFAIAPLYLADRDFGLIIADNSITRAPIEVTGLRLLQIYAMEASAALQNNRLYREVMERVAQCERVNQSLVESQAHLLRAERLSTIGKMAALLAHEIRTPLVSIGGFARRLLRSVEPGDPRKEELEIIVSEVCRLERLIDQVLGYSKMGKPECKSADMNNLVRSVTATMQGELEKAGVQLDLNLDPAIPTVEIDESQMYQALMNLVSNAVDAMPSGGTVTISTRSEYDFLEIGVADTGSGIDQEHWDKLFTPFFTTKVTGTGLGLAIVSQVVENHRGSLRFESVPHEGTTFYIRLALDPNRFLATPFPPGVAS